MAGTLNNGDIYTAAGVIESSAVIGVQARQATIQLGSAYPEYITLIGNWGYTDEDKVIFDVAEADAASTGAVPFGEAGMYPPEISLALLQDKQRYVTISPKIKGSAKNETEKNYCYAALVRMYLTTDPLTGAPQGYSGLGAFSLAYEPSIEYYKPYDNFNVFGLYPKVSNGSGHNVFLYSRLEPLFYFNGKTGKNQYSGAIGLSVILMDSKEGSFQGSNAYIVFEKKINFGPISDLQKENIIEDNGSSDVDLNEVIFDIKFKETLGTVKTSYLPGAFKGIQLISKNEEENYYSENKIGDSESRDKNMKIQWEKFISHYMFDYKTFVDNYWLGDQ